jgi:hypothetical protein
LTFLNLNLNIYFEENKPFHLAPAGGAGVGGVAGGSKVPSMWIVPFGPWARAATGATYGVRTCPG